MSTLTLGSLFTNGQSLLGYFTLGMITVFGITGVYLIYSAGVDVAESSRGRRRIGGWAPFAKIVGAALCYEVPQAVGVVWSQLFSSSTPEQALGAQASGGAAPTNCIAQSGTSANPVGCILNNLAVGVVPEFITFVLVLAAVSGIWFWYRFVMAAIDKVSYSDNNAKLPWGYAVVGTLFVGVGAFIAFFGNSIGFSGGSISASGYSASAAFLAYIPQTSNMSPQYQQMLTGAYAVIAAIGVYEVVHGGYILASAMNGQSHSSGWKAAGHTIFGMCLVFLPSLAESIAKSAVGSSSF